MVTVLLIEDEREEAEEYLMGLQQAGVDVVWVKKDDCKGLSLDDIEIIISDTELGSRDGDEICKELYRLGKIDNTLLIGMSSDRDNDQCWARLAHEFLYKRGITDLGKTVKLLYNVYLKHPGMPRYREYTKI